LFAASWTMTAIIKVSISKVSPRVRRMTRPLAHPRMAATAPATTSPLSGSPQPCAASSPAV
jgi:hypothetical protein